MPRLILFIGLVLSHALCAQRDVVRLPETRLEVRYAGLWRTILSGTQDEITVAQLEHVIGRIERWQASSNKIQQEGAAKWVTNFRGWLGKATDGLIQPASQYQQEEDFVFGASGYYQVNKHNGGYPPVAPEHAPKGFVGTDQVWRSGGWWVIRRTYIGLDEVFEIQADDATKLKLPFYVLLAEEARRLEVFIRDNGKAEKDRASVMIYSGTLPALSGVTYPAWWDVGYAMIVMQESSTSDVKKLVISIRDAAGGVMQELTTLSRDSVVFDAKKAIYLPFSPIVYNSAHVRLINRDAAVGDIPSLKVVFETPIVAEQILDTRNQNLAVPASVALGGDKAIEAWIASLSGKTPAKVEGGAPTGEPDDPPRDAVPSSDRNGGERTAPVAEESPWLPIILVVGTIVVVGMYVAQRRRKSA